MAPPTLCLSEYDKLTFSVLLIYFSRLCEMISRVLVQKSIPDLSRFEQRKTNLEFDLVFTPQNHVFIVENANFTFCKHGQCWSILGMRLKSIAGKLSRLDWMKLNSANNAFALFSKGATSWPQPPEAISKSRLWFVCFCGCQGRSNRSHILKRSMTSHVTLKYYPTNGAHLETEQDSLRMWDVCFFFFF